MSLRLNGSTSGYVEIDAPAVAGSNTLTLPDGNGSSGQALQTNGTGTLSWGPGVANDAQLCKAWVNFDGTGTVAIRASYNVSSITDNGTGDYTVNFTSAIADANYSCVGASGGLGGTSNGAAYLYDQATARTTALIRLLTITTSGNAVDTPQINVAIFR